MEHGSKGWRRHRTKEEWRSRIWKKRTEDTTHGGFIDRIIIIGSGVE